MRIALEALFLTDTDNDTIRGQLRFRLAPRGAWNLGEDPANRRENFSIASENPTTLIQGLYTLVEQRNILYRMAMLRNCVAREYSKDLCKERNWIGTI